MAATAAVVVAEAGSLGILNNLESRGRGKLVRVFFYPYVSPPIESGIMTDQIDWYFHRPS